MSDQFKNWVIKILGNHDSRIAEIEKTVLNMVGTMYKSGRFSDLATIKIIEEAVKAKFESMTDEEFNALLNDDNDI